MKLDLLITLSTVETVSNILFNFDKKPRGFIQMPGNNPTYLHWEDTTYWTGHMRGRKGSHYSWVHWETKYTRTEDPRPSDRQGICTHRNMPSFIYFLMAKNFWLWLSRRGLEVWWNHTWDVYSVFLTLQSSPHSYFTSQLFCFLTHSPPLIELKI